MEYRKRALNDPYMLIAAGSGPRKVELPNGNIVSADQVKIDLGYPQLYAWKNEKKALNEFLEYLKNHPDCKSKLVVDSSAFSAWTKGIEIDIDEYISFINSISEYVYWFAELDKIPGIFGGMHTNEELQEAAQVSWENYLYIIERVNCPKKILPIYHQGEDIKYLKQILDFRFKDGSKIEYMGISPDNGVSVSLKTKWYEQIWQIIKNSSNPDILTHNFGMTSIDLIEQFPSMSSDSTSWLKYASFGNIIVVINGKAKTIYMSNRNMMHKNHFLNQPLEIQKEVRKICARIGNGITPEILINNDDNGSLRCIYNLYALDDWRKSFKYKGNNLYTNDLWRN